MHAALSSVVWSDATVVSALVFVGDIPVVFCHLFLGLEFFSFLVRRLILLRLKCGRIEIIRLLGEAVDLERLLFLMARVSAQVGVACGHLRVVHCHSSIRKLDRLRLLPLHIFSVSLHVRAAACAMYAYRNF